MQKSILESSRQITGAVSLICLVAAVAEFIQPQLARPTGRWSILFGPIWDAFGWGGLVGYWVVMAAIFAAAYFFKGKR